MTSIKDEALAKLDRLFEENQLSTQLHLANAVHAIAQLAYSRSSKAEDLKIQDLNLDDETKQAVEQILAEKQMMLAELVQKSLKYYTNTLMGKSRQRQEDLANISTEQLLYDAFYSCHPNRVEELVGRAIQAIKIYNSRVNYRHQRYCITQSIITQLTGSRADAVKSALNKYQSELDIYHKQHGFLNNDGELDVYLNRKKGVDIKEKISLIDLVPNKRMATFAASWATAIAEPRG